MPLTLLIWHQPSWEAWDRHLWLLFSMQSLGEAVQKSKAFTYAFRDVIQSEILSVVCNCVYLSAASSCVRRDFCKQEGNDSVPGEDWQNKPPLLLTWCSAEQCPTLGKYFLLHFHKYLCNSFWEACLLQKTEHAAPWHKFNCLFTHERLWACTQPRIFTFLSQAFLSFRVLLPPPPRDHIMSWATELSFGSGIWTSPMLFGELLFWAAEIGSKCNVLPGITLLSCPVMPFPFWFEAPL